MRAWFFALVGTAVLGLSGCGYNSLQQQDESVKAAWSEVVNQYQRRADLIPNLVNTVKGYAAQEQKVLIGVTEARARASSIQVTPEVLKQAGLIRSTRQDVKILGNGDLSTKLTVVAHAVSASAREKIEKAGGTVSLLREPKVKKAKHKPKPVAEQASEAPEEQPPQEEPAEEAKG